VVSILAQGDGGNLVRVGAIDKIAPGEDIRAVRFDVARQIPMAGAMSLPLSGFASSESYETASLDPSSATLTAAPSIHSAAASLRSSRGFASFSTR